MAVASLVSFLEDRQNVKAALIMILSMAMFTTNDAIIKYLSDGLPTGQILFIRGVIVSLLFVALLRYQKQAFLPRQSWNRWNLLRSLFELLAACTYLTGRVLLPLATAVVLVFCGPIMFTLLATVVLKEDVGWRRWCAVLLGFFEVVLVADLQQASWTSWALLLPLLAAFLTAARDLFVRNIPSVLSSTQVAFTTAWVVTLGGLATLPFGWKALDSEQFLLLALASVFILIAYLSYVITTRIGELSYVAPFKYTSIPLAMLMGYLIWDDIPSNMSYLGTAIIISSGLFILIRNDSKAASIKQQEPLVTELN